MSNESRLEGLLDEIDLGSARGGRRVAAPLMAEVVRALGPEDLPALTAPAPVGAPGQALRAIRHSHHQLAQLMARGVPQAEIALVTGYSPSYISILKGDPAFAELLAHYGSERAAVFVDVLERMKALGLSTLEELQDRLAQDPEGWSRRELMELAELCLLKGASPGRGAGSGAGAAAVSVNVKFVTAQVPEPGPQLVVEEEVVELAWTDVSTD